MHKSVMRQLLPLAVVCLLAAQLAAGARITPGRSLLRQLVPDNVTLGRQQFVQATWALQNKTCDEVSAQLNNPFVNNTLAQKVILDFQAELTRQGWPEAAKTVVAVRQPCVTFDINGTKYASYRVLVRFNSTTTTAVKDTMYLGAVSGPCVGGYNKTLYSNVAALFKDFKVSQNNANRQNVWNNGVPNWIEYAAPNMTVCQPKPSPSPSPSPVPVDSPSPSPVASPSPSPSPSPTPDPCPSNATLVNGTCTCNAGLLPSTNGTILISCTAGTTCPAAAPVAIKDQTGVTTGCITTNTPCPASNSLVFYSGSPSVRIECRNNPGGCNVPPFSILVQNTAGTVIGCANVTSNDCPFVAFRNGITTNWALAKCQDVTSCPVLSTGNTDYTVPLLLTNAPNAVPKACVTVLVTSQQTCPSTSSLNFPVEVMFAEPTSPVCGSELSVPPQVCNGNKVIACYAPGVDCVAPYSLRLFTNTTGPTVAECRQLRTVCDLTTTGMGPLNPNANSYTLPTFNGQNVEGCMIAGTTACPAGYPTVLQNSLGGLAGCQKINQTLNSCPTGQIGLYNAAGALQSCQAATTPCPATFPITLWNDLLNNRGGCYANGTTQCPSGYTFPTYGAFTARPNILSITNCFKDASVTSCAAVSVVPGAVQSGAEGTYPISILNSNNATVGCLQTGAPNCPSTAPFPLINYDGTNTARPSGTIVSCLNAAPTTCSVAFPTPAMTQGALSGCISITGISGSGALKCPANFPIVATITNNPSLVTSAASITMCMSASSSCLTNAPTVSPFTVVTSSPTQAFCVTVVGLNSCANYTIPTYAAGLPIYSTDGLNLIGCTQATTCPATFFPFFFLNGQQPTPATVRCQASLAPGSTCASVAGGLYPLPVPGASGTVVGCQALSTNCSPGQIPVAENATTSESVACLPPGSTSCPPTTYTFPLYSGSLNSNTGGATLVRCIRDPGQTTCNGAALNTFPIEVYGPTGANVIGCVAAAPGLNTTYCPAGQSVAHMTQGTGTPISFTLAQCRPIGSSCGAGDGTTSFTIPIRNVPQLPTGDVIVGCLASTSNTCPGAAGTVASSSPLFAPFFVLGGGTTGLVECRQVPNPPSLPTGSCENFLGQSTPYTIPTTTAAGALAGCSASGASCPAGFVPTYSDAGVAQAGCVSTNCTASTASPIALYNVNGVQIGCGTTTACTNLGFTVKLRGEATVANPVTAAQTGCMNANATACPASLGPVSFTKYKDPANLPGRPVLDECWVSASGGSSCNAFTGAWATVAASSGTITNLLANPSNPLRGCTPVSTGNQRLCPAAAPYFVLTTATLTLADGDKCLINRPTSCSTVPLVDGTISTSNAPIAGCIGTAAFFTSLSTVGSSCPGPNVLPTPDVYSFSIATASGLPGITAGDVIQCMKPGITCTSPSIAVGTNTTSAGSVACLVNVGSTPTCPATGATGGSYTWLNYGPTAVSGSTVTDATARLELCSIIPTGTTCSGTYSVPVSNNALDAALTTTTACLRATTACPPSSYPIIDATNVIVSCRTARGTTTACAAGFVPMCGLAATSTPNDGACTVSTTDACSAFGGATAPNTTCALAAANKFPLAAGYPIFTATLPSPLGGPPATTVSCWGATVITCGASGAPTPTVLRVRATTGGVLNGCTNGFNDATWCNNWWTGASRSCIVQS